MLCCCNGPGRCTSADSAGLGPAFKLVEAFEECFVRGGNSGTAVPEKGVTGLAGANGKTSRDLTPHSAGEEKLGRNGWPDTCEGCHCDGSELLGLKAHGVPLVSLAGRAA